MTVAAKQVAKTRCTSIVLTGFAQKIDTVTKNVRRKEIQSNVKVVYAFCIIMYGIPQ